MKKHAFSEFVMFGWKQIVICLICLSSTVFAETTLTIVTDEYPPYVSESPEESFLTALLQEAAKEMGVTFVFKFMPWKRCEIALEELKAWGAVPYVPTPEREKKYYFSDKLYHRQSMFFSYSPDGKDKQIKYNELSDLKGYKIGGVIGYYYEKPFHEAGLNVDLVTTEEHNFKKLAAGRVDLIPANDVLGWYLIKKLFPPEDAGKFFMLEKPMDVSGDFLITSKQYPDTQNLLTRFNEGLKKIKENGVYQKVLDKQGIALKY